MRFRHLPPVYSKFSCGTSRIIPQPSGKRSTRTKLPYSHDRKIFLIFCTAWHLEELFFRIPETSRIANHGCIWRYVPPMLYNQCLLASIAEGGPMFERRPLRRDANTSNPTGSETFVGEGTSSRMKNRQPMHAHHPQRHRISKEWRSCPCAECAIRKTRRGMTLELPRSPFQSDAASYFLLFGCLCSAGTDPPGRSGLLCVLLHKSTSFVQLLGNSSADSFQAPCVLIVIAALGGFARESCPNLRPPKPRTKYRISDRHRLQSIECI